MFDLCHGDSDSGSGQCDSWAALRREAVRDPSQFRNPVNNVYDKPDADTGRIMDGKSDGSPFKGVRKEKRPRGQPSSPPGSFRLAGTPRAPNEEHRL